MELTTPGVLKSSMTANRVCATFGLIRRTSIDDRLNVTHADMIMLSQFQLNLLTGLGDHQDVLICPPFAISCMTEMPTYLQYFQ